MEDVADQEEELAQRQAGDRPMESGLHLRTGAGEIIIMVVMGKVEMIMGMSMIMTLITGIVTVTLMIAMVITTISATMEGIIKIMIATMVLPVLTATKGEL
jgi:hypothetical protein